MASSMAYLLPGVPPCQPTHLDGDMQFATEILPGPPSVAAIQQSLHKRDPRKPLPSYLPPSDPGTTYSGVYSTVVGQDSDLARTKRSRMDKGAVASRAQRASARQQNGSQIAEGTDPVPTISSTEPITIDDDEPRTVLSRSSSAQNLLDPASSTTNGRHKRKDKGKAKETDLVVKIKEEPRAVSLLNSPEPAALLNQVPNEDHCSSCRSPTGALVYCDGCPRSFHFMCLNPPMENAGNTSSIWYCPACQARKHPPRKATPALFSSLVHILNTSIPTEFQLPEDIRTFFKDVSTGDKGTYIDTSEIKPPRLNRHGQLEERDSNRLRDKNGHPVLCFRCGTSALPESVAPTTSSTKRARKATAKAVQYEMWKNIISCDYCNLHWHLDCLDPPLLTMPSFSKKWMCPNHSEQILQPKRRIPKQNMAPVEITKPRQFNNGNIDVTHSESAPSVHRTPKVPVDEVLINGRRYRVPERIILLDFWNRINKGVDESATRLSTDVPSPMSSPLTSLSSLDDSDQSEPSSPVEIDHHSAEDLKVAHMLCNMRTGQAILPTFRRLHDIGTQTDTPLASTSSLGPRVIIPLSKPSDGLHDGASHKRKRATPPPQSPPPQMTEPEFRRSRNSPRYSRLDDAPDAPDFFKGRYRVKLEDSDLDASHGTVSKFRSNGRRRKYEQDEPTPKRPKKRKERDDEGAYVDRSRKGKQPRKTVSTRERSTRAVTRPVAGPPLSSATATSSLTSLDSPAPSLSAPPSAPPSVPTTPLKIRLPRLSLVTAATSTVTTNGQ